MMIKLLGVALTVFVAVPAAAMQSVTITSAGIYNPGNVDATFGGATHSEYAVPLTFAATAAGAARDFLGFCVDLPHSIYVGVGSQLQETLAYHVAPLTQNGYGNALSNAQVRQITGLADLGFGIAKGTAADKPAQLAAIQQAIWTIEYPTSTFAATGPYAAAQAEYAAKFVNLAPTLKGTFARTIVANNGATQSQITNVGGVPEPAGWAMMLAGFALVGAATRGRRSAMTVVAA